MIELRIQQALDQPLIFALVVGSLTSALSLILMPVAIYYLTGLAPVETFDYASRWLFRYWGTYIYGQAVGVGAVAGIITYGLKSRLLARGLGAKQGAGIGLFGAFFGFLSSLVYICCAPLILSLIILIGSSSVLYVVRYNEEIAGIALGVQTVGVFVAVLGMAHAKKKACYACDSRSHGRGIPPLKWHGLSLASLTVLGLIGIVASSAVAVNFIPEASLESRGSEVIVTGALEVHVFDIEGNIVPAAVRISGPLITQETSEAGTFFFPSLPPGSYKIMAGSPGLQAVGFRTTVDSNEATHVVFELGAESSTAYLEEL